MVDKNTSEHITIDVNPNQTPILYTDNVFMSTNPDGVTIDICQRVGNSNKLQIVARIGMSRTHAKKMTEKLSKLLALTEGTSQTIEKRKN